MINIKNNTKCYKKNCVKYHPDKVKNASAEEIEETTKNFALNAFIYQILNDKNLYDEMCNYNNHPQKLI